MHGCRGEVGAQRVPKCEYILLSGNSQKGWGIVRHRPCVNAFSTFVTDVLRAGLIMNNMQYFKLKAFLANHSNNRINYNSHGTNSICGPKAVILHAIKSKFETFLKRSSGNSYFQAAKVFDFSSQNG